MDLGRDAENLELLPCMGSLLSALVFHWDSQSVGVVVTPSSQCSLETHHRHAEVCLPSLLAFHVCFTGSPAILSTMGSRYSLGLRLFPAFYVSLTPLSIPCYSLSHIHGLLFALEPICATIGLARTLGACLAPQWVYNRK